eukprot:66694-Prymnesium_polylepis.1
MAGLLLLDARIPPRAVHARAVPRVDELAVDPHRARAAAGAWRVTEQRGTWQMIDVTWADPHRARAAAGAWRVTE